MNCSHVRSALLKVRRPRWSRIGTQVLSCLGYLYPYIYIYVMREGRLFLSSRQFAAQVQSVLSCASLHGGLASAGQIIHYQDAHEIPHARPSFGNSGLGLVEAAEEVMVVLWLLMVAGC